jgi:hypothetical protein
LAATSSISSMARPVAQRARDAGAQAAVGQQVHRVFGECGVAAVGGAAADGLGAQAVGQVAGADDLQAVGEDHQADRGAGEVVAVDQRIDQQLLQRLLPEFPVRRGY